MALLELLRSKHHMNQTSTCHNIMITTPVKAPPGEAKELLKPLHMQHSNAQLMT